MSLGLVQAEERPLPDGLGVVDYPARQEAEAERVETLAARCARAVAERLGRGLSRPARIVLCDTEVGFARRFAEIAGGGEPPGYALALAFPRDDVILVRTARLQAGTWSDLESTLSHELAHLVLGDVEGERGERLPRWLNEGLAEFASGRALLPAERSALAGAARHGTLPHFSEWELAFPQHGDATSRAYTTACAFVQWIDGEAVDGVSGLVARLAVGSVDDAFQGELGWTAVEAEDAWLERIAADHSWWSSLLYSLNLWGVVALIAVAAFVRQGLKTRKLRQELIRQEELEDARLARRPRQELIGLDALEAAREARLAAGGGGRHGGTAEHDQAAEQGAEEGARGDVPAHEEEHPGHHGEEEHAQAPGDVLAEALDQKNDVVDDRHHDPDQDQDQTH